MAEKSVKEHSKIQPPPLQDESSSEHADLPEQGSAWKPVQAQKSTDPEDGGKTPETQEPSEQEKEHEMKDLLIRRDSRNVSETPSVRAERKGWRGPGTHGTAGQEESKRKTQSPALGDQTQSGKYQQLQESSKEWDAKEGSMTQELNSGGGEQNHPDIEGAATLREEARHGEEGIAEALMGRKHAPAAERTPEATEGIKEMAPLENVFGKE